MTVPIKSEAQAARVTRVGAALAELNAALEALEEGDVPAESTYEGGSALLELGLTMRMQAMTEGYEPPDEDGEDEDEGEGEGEGEAA